MAASCSLSQRCSWAPRPQWQRRPANTAPAPRLRRHCLAAGSSSSSSSGSGSGSQSASGTGGPQQQPQQPDPSASSSPSNSAASGGGGVNGSSNNNSGGGPGVSTFSRSPWELMGRVVQEDRIALQFDQQLNQGLVRSAAARESGLEVEEFEQRLQRLLALVPALQQRLLRMKPKLLAALAADPDLVAARLIELKALLPEADASAIVCQRPSLLLDGEWERVAEGAAALLVVFSEQEAARLASAEPLLLVENVGTILEEMQRLMPQQDVAAALLRQPSLASSVSRLSHLSLWLAGGADARSMLLRDPSTVYSVQRGTRSLGPGAEFM